jgi:hypothetical protein
MPPGCASGAPGVTTEPTNQTACAGSSVSFVVNASGTNLTYQWRKGTTNLSNAGNISGANSAILTIDSVSVSDTSSTYNVIIHGSFSPGDTSPGVSLMLNAAPAITTGPAGQTACVGNSVSFSVAATGTGITYQWRKGTVNLTDGGNISGVTTNTLTIDSVNMSDTTSGYNVVITGTCLPNDTSVSATLTLCPTGIISVANGNTTGAVTIYPNPFSTSINILINDALRINNVELRIYNVLGQSVMNTVITKQLTVLETDNLPPGIYIYNVIGNNKVIQSGRVISQKQGD